MNIDIVFDTVCPWCFIGSRRLRRAVEMSCEAPIAITWRPFLLNPDFPQEGVEYPNYLTRKLGSSHRIERFLAAARDAGMEEDIAFNFDGIKTMPNSIDSHRLIQWANGMERQANLVEDIFCAFFLEGRDIGDKNVLIDIARQNDFPANEIKDWLNSEEGRKDVQASNAHVRRWGVSGVPCFVFAGNCAMAGAMEAEILAHMISISREIEPTNPSSQA